MKSTLFFFKKWLPNQLWTKIHLILFSSRKSFPKRSFISKKILVTFYIIVISITSIHANNSDELKVWIDFVKRGDTVQVNAMVSNSTNTSIDVQWKLNIQFEKKAARNFSDKATIQAKSNPKQLSNTEIIIKDQDPFKVIFELYDLKNKLIGADTLESLEVDPSLKKMFSQKQKNKVRVGNSNLDALEIDGLIFDETKSKIGRDFYELFYNKWTPPPGAKDFWITIKELPSRGLGATVTVQVNEDVVLYRFLQPRGALIEEEANLAISYLQNYLQKNENIKQDLESGDQSGSGIF